jgi:hypothetical protein
MRPPRMPSRFLSAMIGMWLAIAVAVPAVPLSAQTLPQPITPRRKAPPIAQEKERVPREKPREKPAGDKKSSGSSSSSSSSDDDASDCGSGCFPSLFESSSPSPSSPASESIVAAPRGWAVYDHGWLRAKAPGDSLMLFQGPVEAGRENVPIGALPDGAEIVVEEIHALPSGLELRVRPADRLEPFGWIAADVVSTTKPAPPPAPKPDLPRSSPGSFHLAVGGGALMNTELDEEYVDGGFHIEAHYQGHPPGPPTGNWMWSAGAGYWDFKGNPQFDYQDSADTARFERPYRSTLRIASFALEGGGRFGTDRGLRVTLALGPTLFYVHEDATVETIVDSTKAVVDTRNEELGRFTGGAVGRVVVGYRFAGGFEIGFQLDGYWMAWNGRREKSLTTDFTENSIGGLDGALSLTVPAP